MTTTLYRIGALILLLLVTYVIWSVLHYNRKLAEKNRSLYLQIQERERAKMIIYEFRKSKFETQNPESFQNQQIYRKLYELMQDPEVYTDPNVDNEVLARRLGIDQTHLVNALHECADTTASDFINLYRIRHAAWLLATTDDPVWLITKQCGISNRSTFARLFREYYCMTPAEYRIASRNVC